MKVITLKIKDIVFEANVPTPVEKEFQVEIPYSENNMAWATERSIDGNIEVLEREDPIPAPSQLDIMEAQVTYTAMMTETLLEV